MSADARDEVLRALYRDATSELPRAEADAAVLRMARQAVADTPSRSTRWSPRLALAATVVLAVGLVTRVQLDAPDLQPATAPAKATPAAGAEPAATVPVPATAPEADAPRAAIVAQASRQRQTGDDVASPARPAVSKLREQAGTSERQDTGDAAAKENASAQGKKTEIAGPQPAASDTVGAVTESASRRNGSDLKKDRDPAGDRRTLARSETRSAESVQADTAAPAATPFAGASAPLPAAPAAPPPAVRPAPALSAPAARMQAGPQELEHRASNDEIPETMLNPEQWAARIATMRKSGRHAAADASLKRLTEKFPGFKVPPEARSPEIE